MSSPCHGGDKCLPKITDAESQVAPWRVKPGTVHAIARIEDIQGSEMQIPMIIRLPGGFDVRRKPT